MDITPRDPAGHFGQNPECNGTRSPNLSRVFAVGEAQVKLYTAIEWESLAGPAAAGISMGAML